MTLRGKLLFGYIFVAMVVTVVAFMTYRSTDALDDAFAEVSQETLPVIEALHDLRYYGARVVVTSSGLAFAISKSGTEELTAMQEAQEHEFALALDQYEAAAERYRAMLSGRAWRGDPELFNIIVSTSVRLQTLLQELLDLERAGAAAPVVVEKIEEVEVYETTFVYAVDAALAGALKQFSNRENDVRAAISQTRNMAVMIGPIIVLVAVLIAVYLSRLITRGLVALKNASLALAAGHWDTRISQVSKDELGDVARTFNKMAAALKAKSVEVNATKAYLDKIIDTMVEPVVVTEPDGKIRTVNRALEELLGYTDQALVGKSLSMLHCKSERELVKSKWLPKLASGGVIEQRETSYLSREGRVIPVVITASCLRDERNIVHGIVYIGQASPPQRTGQGAQSSN